MGTGQVEVVGVIKEAKKLGIKHYFIEDESPIWYQQVPKSIAYLKSLEAKFRSLDRASLF